MNIDELIKLLNYAITEGGTFGWDCYGENSRYLDFEKDDIHLSAVFDQNTQELYEVDVYDGNSDSINSFKWINEKYLDAYNIEIQKRNINEKDDIIKVSYDKIVEIIQQ